MDTRPTAYLSIHKGIFKVSIHPGYIVQDSSLCKIGIQAAEGGRDLREYDVIGRPPITSAQVHALKNFNKLKLESLALTH